MVGISESAIGSKCIEIFVKTALPHGNEGGGGGRGRGGGGIFQSCIHVNCAATCEQDTFTPLVEGNFSFVYSDPGSMFQFLQCKLPTMCCTVQ